MSSVRRPPAEIAKLRKRRDDLFVVVVRLQEKRDLETRIEEQLRLDSILAEHQTRLAEADAAVLPLELVEKADDLERKQSWSAAIATWEQLAVLLPNAAEPPIEVVRLRERERFGTRLHQLTTGLVGRRTNFGNSWHAISSLLQELRTSDAVGDIDLVPLEGLLAGTVKAEHFLEHWHECRRKPTSPTTAAHPFKILAERLQRGDIALLLGSEIAHESNGRLPGNAELILQLAHKADAAEAELGGSLALVAEFYDLTEYGRSSLVRNLRESLPAASELPLYQMLASLAAPLVLLSTTWDTLLEQAFRQAGKPFAVVSPLLASRAAAVEFSVERSDSATEEQVASEGLSGLRLLDRYSLIFKVRGAIPPEPPEHSDSLSTPLLTERDHFAFARRQDQLLPTYLTRKLAERSLLILGLSVRHWEDRLLLDAVFDKRLGGDKPFVAGRAADRFAEAFWREHAKSFDLSLPAFVDQLAAYLRPEVQK
jgi:hypothetical protein